MGSGARVLRGELPAGDAVSAAMQAVADHDAWRAAWKLRLCVRSARECARNSRYKSDTRAHRAEYRRMQREAMQDARYWRDKLRAAIALGGTP